jgi:hypothetical protein
VSRCCAGYGVLQVPAGQWQTVVTKQAVQSLLLPGPSRERPAHSRLGCVMTLAKFTWQSLTWRACAWQESEDPAVVWHHWVRKGLHQVKLVVQLVGAMLVDHTHPRAIESPASNAVPLWLCTAFNMDNPTLQLWLTRGRTPRTSILLICKLCKLCCKPLAERGEDGHVGVPPEQDAPPQEALGLPGAHRMATCMRYDTEDFNSVRPRKLCRLRWALDGEHQEDGMGTS